MIFQRCDAPTLCDVRLASKEFAFISQSPFWHDVRLVPNVDCLTDFLDLLQHSSAGQFVRHLIYDSSWQFISTELRSLSEHPERRKLLPTSTGSLENTTSILLRCYEATLDPSTHKGTELLHLRRLLCTLSNVRKITVDDEYRSIQGHGTLPPYFRQVCRKAGIIAPIRSFDFTHFKFHDSSRESHWSNMLMVVKDSEIQCTNFTLQNLRFEGFFSGVQIVSPPEHDYLMQMVIFKKMKHLDLSFAGSYNPLTDPARLRDVFKKCYALRDLHLSFTPLTDRAYAKNQHANSVLTGLLGRDGSRRPLLAHLRRLCLNQITSTEQELIRFLTLHSSTLRHLEISNGTLVSEPDSPRRGCWVAVIKGLKSNLSLETVHFRNWLSNGARQCWYISSEQAYDMRIRPQVEHFITNKSVKDCPLNSAAIKPENDDVLKPANGAEVEGDWTWTMTYAGCKGWPKKNPMVSGSYMFSNQISLDTADPTMYDSTFWKPMPLPKSKYAAVKTKYPSSNTYPTISPFGHGTGNYSLTHGSTNLLVGTGLAYPVAPVLVSSSSNAQPLQPPTFSTPPSVPYPAPTSATPLPYESFDFDAFLDAAAEGDLASIPTPPVPPEGATGDLLDLAADVAEGDALSAEDEDDNDDISDDDSEGS